MARHAILVVAEVKTKKTRNGITEYRNYRCTRYNSQGHPRIRVEEADLDAQVLDLFARMKVQDEKICAWVRKLLQAKAENAQQSHSERFSSLKRQLTLTKHQKAALLNLRLVDEIDRETFAAKHTELRDIEQRLELDIEAHGRRQSEYADLAIKAFELSQALQQKWDSVDIPEKRQILEVICLNFALVNLTLVPKIRRPFDVLAEGLVCQNGRGDWI